MDNILNLGFPLLSNDIPRVCNSLAIWAVVLDAVCDFTRYASNSFKIRKYYHEDSFIARALEGIHLLIIFQFLCSMFALEHLSGIMIYFANLALLVAVCSISNVILLCISKFDYSELLGMEDYSDKMAKIRRNRTTGGVLLAIVCVILRVQIALYKYNLGIVWVILFIINTASMYQFNCVSHMLKEKK